MLGHNPFYLAYTRTYIAVFGTLFNDIQIQRPHDTDQVQTIKVPLTYASHDKMMARVFGDPDLTRKVAAVTPAMSIECSAPRYDSERKLQSTLRRCYTDENGTQHQFIGVPYNWDFTLRIYAREEEDGLRILEQITPFFTPSMQVNVTLVPQINYKINVPIILNEIDKEDLSYGEMDKRRRIVWSLRFTLKGEMAGPISPAGNTQIRTIHVNFDDLRTRAILEEVHIEPGLTANGEPTSVRANSVPITQITEDDNYGYVIEILEGPTPHE